MLESLLPQVSMMQGELKTVKEFRKRRAETEAQLGQLRASLSEAEREHQAALQALEQRFFEEKVSVCAGCSGFRGEVSVTCRQVRLQKEANRRIAELSEKAHSEAVRYAPPQPPLASPP